MNKKIFISIAISLVFILASTLCFATENMIDDVSNGVRDVVNGAKDATENVVDGSKNAINTTEETTGNIAGTISNTSKNITGSMENGMQDGMSNYDAKRLSTDNTFLGMTNNMWTWLIVGITAIAIIALIWYYSMQYTNNNHYHSDDE